MPAALARGSVAGAFLAEPTLSQATEVTVLADAYAAIGNGFLISNWFTTRDWLGAQPRGGEEAGRDDLRVGALGKRAS